MLSILRPAAQLALACPLLLLAACGSTGGKNVGNTTQTSGSVTLRDYTRGTTMKLVSDSSLVRQGVEGDTFEERRVNFYSMKTVDASAKACHDDAITGLVQAFSESGLEEFAVEGPAPLTGALEDQSFEVEVDGRRRHVVKSQLVRVVQLPDGTTEQQSEILKFVNYLQLFVEVYNAYEGHSSVKGRVEFEQPTYGDQFGGNR